MEGEGGMPQSATEFGRGANTARFLVPERTLSCVSIRNSLPVGGPLDVITKLECYALACIGWSEEAHANVLGRRSVHTVHRWPNCFLVARHFLLIIFL